MSPEQIMLIKMLSTVAMEAVSIIQRVEEMNEGEVSEALNTVQQQRVQLMNRLGLHQGGE